MQTAVLPSKRGRDVTTEKDLDGILRRQPHAVRVAFASHVQHGTIIRDSAQNTAQRNNGCIEDLISHINHSLLPSIRQVRPQPT